MVGCSFCNLDTTLFYNKIIEETENFIVIPGVGALVEGYVLILPKKHSYCMTNFSKDMMEEYNNILNKYRNIFKKIYAKFPIIFEHGTPDPSGLCASCIIHAHTHIINHNYKDEQRIISKLNLHKINGLSDIEKRNYIYYKSPNGVDYITYDFEPISQIMRIFIAEDLGIRDKFNWRKYPYEDNIRKMIEDLKFKE